MHEKKRIDRRMQTSVTSYLVLALLILCLCPDGGTAHTVFSTAAETALQYARTAKDNTSGRPLIDVTDTASSTGAALVTLSPGDDTTTTSWRIENTGTQRIAALHVHMENAMIPDIVLTTANGAILWRHQDQGATQPVPVEDYQFGWSAAAAGRSGGSNVPFDPTQLEDMENLFVDDLADTGTTTVAEGFRGMLLLFQAFGAGKVYEGSTEALIPHSFSGLQLTTVNEHATWNVGSVSGAELINSVVTVLFGDGSSASGTLASDGSQTGAIALVTTDGPALPTPSLLIDGLPAGCSGEFPGSTTEVPPHVLVGSQPGTTVRVTKMTAFDPVDNQMGLADGSITVEALVTARLVAQYPTFPVNTAKQLQHVDVVIPASGTLEITDRFQYSVDDDYAVAFTAVAIDGSGVPLSATTMPTRLLAAESDSDNLVVNGSFESNSVATNGRSLVNPELVDGWSTLMNDASIELMGNGKAGVTAVDGSVFLELDSSTVTTTADGVYQDVLTQKDRSYELTFFMQSRSNDIDTEDETVYVEWNGERTSATGYRASKKNEWEKISVSLVGSGATDRLAFVESSETEGNDGTGPFLDLVSLRPTGNMIVNGSFESTVVRRGKFTQPKDSAVQGWRSTTGRMELWGSGLHDVEAVADGGATLLELDVHSSGGLDGVFQTLRTEKGRLYALSFYVRARRTAYSSSSESLSLLWRGQVVKSDFHAAGPTVWTKKIVILEGSGGSDTLLFREVTSDGLGPLLDAVELSPLR